MSEQEQPYGEWLAHFRFRTENRLVESSDCERALRELRQRDEELERLRARVEELEEDRNELLRAGAMGRGQC